MSRSDSALRLVNTLTREQPAGWIGYRRRIDKAMLAEVSFPPEQHPEIFICGPTPLVEDASRFLVELGHPAPTIKTERNRQNSLSWRSILPKSEAFRLRSAPRMDPLLADRTGRRTKCTVYRIQETRAREGCTKDAERASSH